LSAAQIAPYNARRPFIASDILLLSQPTPFLKTNGVALYDIRPLSDRHHRDAGALSLFQQANVLVAAEVARTAAR
jgi:hypothetical protein